MIPSSPSGQIVPLVFSRFFSGDAALWVEVQSDFLRVASLDSQLVLSALREDYVEWLGAGIDREVWCRKQDCNLGRLVADSMRRACGEECDFAHVNAGALRANLKKQVLRIKHNSSEAEVHRGDLSNILQFGNSIVSYTVVGRDFRQFFLQSALDRFMWGAGGWPLFSGLRWARNPSILEKDKQIVAAFVKSRKQGGEGEGQGGEWEPLDPNRMYKVAALNYLFVPSALDPSTGGDGYPILTHVQSLQPFGSGDVDSLARYMQSAAYAASDPPTVQQTKRCNSNNSFVLRSTTSASSASASSGMNVSWPVDAAACNGIITSGIRPQVCPSNEQLCVTATGGLAYADKFYASRCDECSGLGTCIDYFARCACDRPTTEGAFF